MQLVSDPDDVQLTRNIFNIHPPPNRPSGNTLYSRSLNGGIYLDDDLASRSSRHNPIISFECIIEAEHGINDWFQGP